jgi:2-polyprenyl-3-methyl-5-hydroxy-6-metoxy-1,4-benzoquinol methylase
MDLLDIVCRTPTPDPWAEGDKIPWHDPAFSERMLREHLSQAHDAASRRSEIIAAHVEWIHNTLLNGRAGRILDLACGPGLYTQRLAQLGHDCTGIDFAPASIRHAREQAAAEGLTCRYQLEDIRSAPYGAGYDLVMLVFGEFNVFQRRDAESILAKANAALQPDGLLLIEAHTFERVCETGQQPAHWQSHTAGLFSARPHLVLEERTWDATQHVAIERYYVIDAETGVVQRHASSMQAYTDDAYRQLIESSGFEGVAMARAMGASEDEFQAGLQVIVGRKRAKH